MSNLVEVRPLPLTKWHGKKGKESFAQKRVIRAFISAETGRYLTGLTEEDKEHLVKVGFKGNLEDLDLGEPHPTWDSPQMKISLHNKTMFFNKNKVEDYIKICIMRSSKFVANSQEEYDKGYFPEATHVIHDEAVNVEEKASKIEIRNKALLSASKLSNDKKINVILALGGKNLKNQSSNMIITELDNLVMKDPEAFLRVEKRKPEELSALGLVYNCLDKNILRKEGPKILYMDDLVGYTIEEAVSYLCDPTNQQFYVMLLEKSNK